MVLLLFLTGIELGFAMALVGFLGFSFIVSWKAGLNLLAKDFFDVFSSYGFTVIPLFILMGQIAFNAGIAKRLYAAAYKFIGHIPGGLAMATVAGATAFKAICGSSPATAATFASVAVPEMDRYDYDKKLSTGIVATVGTLGILIPPSVTLIVFGIITEQSIGKLFLAGLVPGLIIALFFICIIYGWCKINPALGPKGERSTWKERIASLPEVLWILVIFSAGDRRADAGVLHAHRGRQRGDLRRPGLVDRQAGPELQGLPQIGGRIAAHGLHGADAHRRLRHPRPFPGRHQDPHDHRRLGRVRCPSTATSSW